MSHLNEKERALLALRFFKNQSGAESAAALGIGEWTARKKAARALEKLRRYFSRHGINSTAAVLEQTIAANSVQAAPAALAGTVAGVAFTKGATASVSTLTLIKGALKVMTWTKVKTTVVFGGALILAAGTAVFVAKGMSHDSDVTAIQGKWSGHEKGGQATASLDLQGTNLEFHCTDNNEWYKGTFSLKEGTNPKGFVVTITDCVAPQYVGKISYSVYKIEGNTLTMSGNEPGSPTIPTSFEAPGSRTFVFTKN